MYIVYKTVYYTLEIHYSQTNSYLWDSYMERYYNWNLYSKQSTEIVLPHNNFCNKIYTSIFKIMLVIPIPEIITAKISLLLNQSTLV